MSGYIAFPMTAPEAARWLTDHYGMAVSVDKVRRVIDAIGDGLRVGNGVRLILREQIDGIMSALEAEGYVFSADAAPPPVTEPCEPTGIPQRTALQPPESAVSSNRNPPHEGRRRNRRHHAA